ncbi:cytochrome P450 2K1-like [Scleropages formosus]|uniref:Cytochrome P450 2K1-like n=1 Tax=Scleropages formosus TaxID=113540 RepID=A0A0P7WLI8_SCLFO|nr:cytochrome P450 2K1-like [Scleropages formosus]
MGRDTMSMITTLIWDSASGTLMLIFAALLFLILLFEPSAKDDKYKFPPGPRPWPFIGNLNILDMHRPYNTMCKYVVITGYEAVKQALVNQAEEFGERGLTRATQTFSNGKGVVFSVGESWKTMRRFTLTTLRDVGMGRNTIEDRIVEEAQRLLVVFHGHQGKPFNPRVNIYSAVSNIICHLVFGHHFEYDDPVFLQLQSRVIENLKLMASPDLLVYNLFPKLGAMLRNFKRVKKNMAANRYYFRSVCRQHKAELDSNDLRSFLDSFLAQQKEEKVHAEIERVICKDRALRFEDPKSMPYTDAVVHEIQCFANMVPNNLLHQTKEDTTFRGYHIPKVRVQSSGFGSLCGDRTVIGKSDDEIDSLQYKGTPIIPLLTSVLFDKTQWDE